MFPLGVWTVHSTTISMTAQRAPKRAANVGLGLAKRGLRTRSCFSANFWLWSVVVPRLSTLSILHLRHHGVEVHRQTGYGRRRGRRIVLFVVVGSCAWFGIRFSI